VVQLAEVQFQEMERIVVQMERWDRVFLVERENFREIVVIPF
jgi:hypothetical protein